jgi:hypothetical protein
MNVLLPAYIRREAARRSKAAQAGWRVAGLPRLHTLLSRLAQATAPWLCPVLLAKSRRTSRFRALW